jgi:UDP-N-acetylmuramyl pentapeptide phosphotransferase/UDP-N-acetylglucosamine-1-phosphate transferase
VVSPLLSTALVAAAASGAASVLVVLSQSWHGKHTLDHDLEGVQKFHTTAVPRVGGAALVLAISVALILCHHFFLDLLPSAHLTSAALLLLASMPVFMSGIIEDLTKRVSVKSRLLASIASALAAAWLLGTAVDELNIWGVDALLAFVPVSLIVTAIVVSGGTHAINIIDGFNGLASFTVIVMLAAFGVIGWQVGDMLIAELAILGLGATAGFMMVNYPTGRLFLGDGGAYFLGFWVAEIALLLLIRNASVNAWQILSVCTYPVIEVLYSMYRRRVVRKCSPGAPDGLHLHSLVYRRVVAKFVPQDLARPWLRNAAVALVITPCVALAAAITVVAGSTMLGSILIVLGQTVIYLLLYTRLVRFRWGAARVSQTRHVPAGLENGTPELTIIESGDYSLQRKKRA